MRGGVGGDIMMGDDGFIAKISSVPANEVVVGNASPALITLSMRDAADDNDGSLDLIITDVGADDGDDILSGDAGGDIVLGGGGNDIMGGDVDPRLGIAGSPSEVGRDVLIGDGGIVQFDLRRLLDRRTSELSSGERQRLALTVAPPRHRRRRHRR